MRRSRSTQQVDNDGEFEAAESDGDEESEGGAE
jgi:hypothetical protein